MPSDPILDSNRALKIGWHAGARGARVHRIALAIVSHVASVAAAPRIVAWGGSGGGYAALRLARDHSNTTAFVWNPQTNIAQYSAPAVRAFERAGGYDSSACFADSSDMNLAKPDSWRWFLGSVIYFQESSDWHVEKHLMPVLEAMGSTETIEDLETAVISQPSRALTLVLSRWGDGHVPPPRDVIECVLRGLAGPAPNNLEVAESCRPMLLDARREVEST
ncbi:hypothetical protein [Microbacterium sp.]|uniref:hypothetical protein n=1 Tax=Microbacterium sp. TaxID=51671 RepID=UPI0028123414|nr:hypothetical protein [Microbacterium sp.]